VTFVPPGEPVPAEADLIILPGSKTTIDDLECLRAEGWDIDIRAHLRRGRRVLAAAGRGRRNWRCGESAARRSAARRRHGALAGHRAPPRPPAAGGRVGTQAVLEPDDAAMIRGFIVNRFRGDPTLFADGMALIAARTG
jgi:cobyric acid synthase